MTLEKGGRQDLLAEALMAHGTALARLGCHSQAYATLQYAIEAARQAGAPGRAGEAALILVKELGENISFGRVQTAFSGYGLGEILRHYEKDVIKEALVKAEGSVTRAARVLGVSHQRLIYIINRRHKELLYVRTPAIRRHKSIIKR